VDKKQAKLSNKNYRGDRTKTITVENHARRSKGGAMNVEDFTKKDAGAVR
jgi:hypothetical protein